MYKEQVERSKVINIAEIKYELSVQLQHEQYYAEIEGKLPIFEQKWLDLIHILGVILKSNLMLTKCRV